MSLILDALRKSERTRQQTLTGQVSNASPVQEHTRLPTPWVTLIGLILVLNAIVLAFLIWHQERPVQVKPGRPDMTAASTASAPKPVIRPLADEVTGSDVQLATTQMSAATRQPPPVVNTNTPASATQSADLSAPPLDTLPMAYQQSLPALHMDVHSYAGNTADRFVVINMQRYVAGDTLKEGPRVIAITSQGVILEYQGTRFLLPRS